MGGATIGAGEASVIGRTTLMIGVTVLFLATFALIAAMTGGADDKPYREWPSPPADPNPDGPREPKELVCPSCGAAPGMPHLRWCSDFPPPLPR